MARIPDSELERLKAEVSLVRLVEARGVKLKKKGKDLVGLCPWHDDHRPSLIVSPEKNLWHCLGACGKGGSVIDWTMKSEAVSFRHACELLKTDLPASAASACPPRLVKRSTAHKLAGLLSADAEDQVLLRRVVDYYHQSLKQTPEALAYLKKRGLEGAELVERFKLGFANRTLGYRIPLKNRVEGAAIRGRLERLGVFRESGHEHLAGSLVIPIFDAQGQVVQLYGRKIGDRLRPGTAHHLYLPGPLRGIWNREALQGSREVILCEALLDALTFWCAGYRNVTTAYGVHGIPPELWEDFKTFGTERVLIAFDRDEAGERAAAELPPKLQAAGIAAYRIQFPKGMDANAYALGVKPAAKSLGLVIRNAVWMGEGKAPARPIANPDAETAAPPPSIPGEAAEEKKVEPSAPIAPAPPPLLSSAAGVPPPPPAAEPARVLRIPAPAALLPLERRGDEHWAQRGDRSFRVRGLAKNLSFEALKVSLMASRPGDRCHVDSLDLTSARQRATFIREAAGELGVEEETLKKDLGALLLALEVAQDEEIRERTKSAPQVPQMADADREAAMSLLKAPDLLDQVLRDFGRCGVVGEETNKLVGYLAAVSRKLSAPLAVVIQSSSAAGKSSLMDAVLAFMPEEERVAYSAMTGQALFYMGETNLAHKILAIAEEEGAQRASYALKLLQSEGELTIASTGKDPATGRLETHEYKVKGPVMIFLTTTAIETDEELLNRCLVLTVDEGREQTRAIHRLQRERRTLEGLLEEQARARVVKRHRDAQRLLRPLHVVNPFAKDLTFLDHQTRTRRDHMKYLTLIEAIALLHQYQREVKTAEVEGTTVSYIEVQAADLALANRLAHEVLGRSLDELPPQTRRLLSELGDLVEARAQAQGISREEVRFTRREVREATGMGNTQLKIHLRRLEELEYLLVHAGPRGTSWAYELLYQGEAGSGAPLLPALLAVEARPGPVPAPASTTPTRSGFPGGWSGSEGGSVGGRSAPGRALVGGWSSPPGAPQPGNGSGGAGFSFVEAPKRVSGGPAESESRRSATPPTATPGPRRNGTGG